MSKVSFSITDEEREFFTEYGRRKGLNVSALAKMALFAYESSHHYNDLDLPRTQYLQENATTGQHSPMEAK